MLPYHHHILMARGLFLSVCITHSYKDVYDPFIFKKCSIILGIEEGRHAKFSYK